MRTYSPDERTVGTILADKAAAIGDRSFLRWADDTYTYGDLDAITNRYANGFRSLGVSKGDHVALIMDNGPEILWSIFGLGKLGAVAVPLNTAARGELLHYFLSQSDSTVVCVSPGYRGRLEAAIADIPAVRAVCVSGPVDTGAARNGLRFVDLALFESQSPALSGPFDEVLSTDPHLIMYTSGTTGPSKGVVCPQSQGFGVAQQMASLNGYRADDAFYTCLPVFHANALWYSIYTAVWADASVALFPRFSARSFWDEVRASNATVMNCLGAMANIVWQLPPSDRDRHHRVRICMMVPTSKALCEGFRDRYGITVTSVYAMTENCAVATFTPFDPPEKAPAAGRVREHVDVEIIDDDGRVLPVGGVGEICIRPNERGIIMLGYYKMGDATVESFRDLWFHTGDRGSLDADGYLYFSDRKKEAIRRRGENISAYEVETVICKYPGVVEAAAVPVPSSLGEDDLMVYIVPTPGVDISFDDLIAFCAQNMPYYMVPRYLDVIAVLPKTPSEKIEKYRLKVHAAERLAQLWDREAAGIEIDK